MNFEIDPAKDAANQLKHRVPLAFGALVVLDERRLDVVDTRALYGEVRVQCHGQVAGRVWVAVFTERDGVYRFISVRKANDRETRRYHAHLL
ncbi:BrnT family toxin [Nitrospirillum amazonense]|uniref:Uncharacterized protein n=1 Tax=Nitrospirillum amazonense TaxID=28077 RepID=A0A560G9X3_9PROT|nr:BrnT family toxin [Nitrospirillum amazonense]MDG3441321.1 BrnT family toxin [Nitrospirillum amazonense]MEC4591303.1 BrnT family toxin [Nitrospirillum amazonense]TWB30708.1 hypothetical protein FBZ88_102273 [Nitrospirillum amazonense]TWB80190.1 hypothetical protein FBZ87_102614 [Nitrospirillum amazonense]